VVSVLVWSFGIASVFAWHFLGVGVEREAEPYGALLGRTLLHAVQFGLGYLLGKLYLLRCRQLGGNARWLRWIEALLLPALALVLSTRTHAFGQWFSGWSAWSCFLVALVAWSDPDGGIHGWLDNRFRLDERERALYTHFPPRNLADMMPWHLFVTAFTLWAAWRMVVPVLREFLRSGG
jgi:hypothetical protein